MKTSSCFPFSVTFHKLNNQWDCIIIANRYAAMHDLTQTRNGNIMRRISGFPETINYQSVTCSLFFLRLQFKCNLHPIKKHVKFVLNAPTVVLINFFAISIPFFCWDVQKEEKKSPLGWKRSESPSIIACFPCLYSDSSSAPSVYLSSICLLSEFYAVSGWNGQIREANIYRYKHNCSFSNQHAHTDMCNQLWSTQL